MERRSLFDSVTLAFQDFGRHSRLFLLLGVTYAVLNVVMQLPAILLDVAAIFDGVLQGQFPTLQEMSSEQRIATLLQTGIFFMSSIVNAILWVGGLQLALAIIDDRDAEIWDALCAIERVPLALGWALYCLLTFPAFMCCLIPGYVLRGAAILWPVVSIDRDCGAAAAFGHNLDLFRQNLIGLTGVCMAVVTLSVVGASCFHVASIVTFPVTLLITARAYRILVPLVVEE